MKIRSYLCALLFVSGSAWANNLVGVYSCEDVDNVNQLSYETELTIKGGQNNVYHLLERQHLHSSDPLYTYNHVGLLKGNMLATAWQNADDHKEFGVEIFTVENKGQVLQGSWITQGDKVVSTELCNKQQ